MTIKKNKEDILKTYAPVFVFIIVTFFLEQFGLTKATNLIISVFLSLFSFMVMTAMLKDKYGDYPQRKKLGFQTGLLTTMFIIIFAHGFLHWYKIGHMNIRWTLFFVLLIIYFVLLSRAVHVLKFVRNQLEKAEKKRKK